MGCLSRRRDPDNRRNHIIELTAEGEAVLKMLAPAVLAFDERLRANFTPDELERSGHTDRLSENVGATQTGPPWAGLIKATADRRRALA